MSASKKKNSNGEERMADSGSSSEAESESGDQPQPENFKEIQVDFEGRNPIDSDFHGIRQLLQQLFLKAHINLSELSDLIIAQNYIGSVVTQSEVDDEDDDEEMYDSNMIFGITSAVNLTNKQDVSCIKELRTYIIEKVEQYATDSVASQVKDILGNEARPVGFIFNERFVNIPAQISIPLLENLYNEIKRANNKQMPFNFSQYIMIIKFYRQEAKNNKPVEDIYSNPEEEIVCKESEISCEYSVQAEADSGMCGDWMEGDSSLTPYRKIVLFDANKLPHIILAVKEFINE